MNVVDSLNDVKKQLEKADQIIITSHIHPDGDAIGSCLALTNVLEGLGKTVQVVIDDHVPEIYDILPGFENIQRYEGQPLTADLIVLLDARPGREGRVCSRCPAPVLNIDHHVSNECTADYAYVDGEAAATAEILCGLLHEWGIDLDADVASCLYMGIATDTGFFAFQNTKAKTLEICANLIRAGAEPDKLSAAVRRKSFHEVQELARGFGTMELFAGGRAVGVFLDESFCDLELTDDLIDAIRYIRGIDIAVLLKAEAASSCRVRMRSERCDVSKLAQSLGGGGHKESAGATINAGFIEAKKILHEEITGFLRNRCLRFKK